MSLDTTVNRRYRFCASHRLHSDALSKTQNQHVYGKCNNPYGHGHDYVLDVSVTGLLNATTGLVIGVAELDALVKAEILDSFSYRNLNQDVIELQRLVPTTENIALVIAGRLCAQWDKYFPYSSAWLSGISIQETDRNGFQVVLARPSFRDASRPVSTQVNESVMVHA